MINEYQGKMHFYVKEKIRGIPCKEAAEEYVRTLAGAITAYRAR